MGKAGFGRKVNDKMLSPNSSRTAWESQGNGMARTGWCSPEGH